MTRLALLSVLLCSPASALTADDARHLLLRTGFDAPPAEVAALAPLTRAQAVERVLDTVRTTPSTPPPEWADGSPVRKDRALRKQRGRALKDWWMGEMLATPAPLTELLTLLWHGHFTSSLRKVRSPVLMWRQNQTLRRHALGRFDVLLGAMARDPAMLRYLDGARNRRGAPNENFAREVMELFTLGGGYTEQDVKEAARAFTGWGVGRRDGRFRVRRRHHDPGPKTILGQTGRWRGDDVLRILLGRPETARTVVEALWRHFVSPTPDPTEVTRLATELRASGWALRPLLSSLLRSDAFWASSGALVKSPVDLVVGTVRAEHLEASPTWLRRLCKRLGQDLFDPPDVRGWPHGAAWIDTLTWVERRHALLQVADAGGALLAPEYQLK